MWLRECTIFATIAALTCMAAPVYAQIDGDGDGTPDNIDNCLSLENPAQRDTDGDGIGNRCDADLNNDCIVNPVDLGLFRARFFTTDADADLNGDGVVNTPDLGIFRQLIFAPPGPTGGQNVCSCVPPPQVAQASPNSEFGGQPVYLIGDLAGSGAAVPGLNDFADQDNGVYLARIFARTAGTYGYRVADQSASVDYCADGSVSLYSSVDLPASGCAGAAGSLTLPVAGCYEFRLETDGTVLPDSIAFTPVDRLGRWDFQLDGTGGVLSAPNGVTLDVPAGAVAAPVTLSVGDVACAQVDALFDATALNSHDNRCLGALVVEPAGLTFDLPVSVSVPVVFREPDEFVLWLASEPGREDYTLVETGLTYRGVPGEVEATIERTAIFAASGSTNVNGSPLPTARASLDPCCSLPGPPNPNCCCTTFNVQTTAGDAYNSDCDCQLVGHDLVIEFPNCPGSPVFMDTESHSSEGCPTNLQAGFTPSQIVQWRCEETEIDLKLGGTNADGSACIMAIPATWSVGGGVASVEEVPPGTQAVVTGATAGTGTIDANSSVGSQFSFSAPLNVIEIAGAWEISEIGAQTCVTNDIVTEEFDAGSEVVPVNVPACDSLSIDVGISGLDGVSGALVATRMPDTPLTLTLSANGSSNTLGCYTFFATGAQTSDFGSQMCPPDGNCTPLNCVETTTTQATFQSANTVPGVGTGGATWAFNATWSQTIDDETLFFSTSCNGGSNVQFIKQ